MQLLTNYL